MVYALMTGRGGSRSIKDKNIYPVLGRPLLAYPILAAKHSELVKEVYMTTDSRRLADVARQWGAKIIMRPAELGEDQKHAEAMVHGYETIRELEGLKPKILVILMANCPTITLGIIDRGIRILLEDSEEKIDSCVTVSKYNEFNPMRARVIRNGFLEPAIDPEYFVEGGFLQNVSGHDRDGLGDFYFCDGAAWIVRSRCMDLSRGTLPYRWIGSSTVALVQEGGMDVDNERGLANAEFWLKKHGFTETTTPYDTWG
jgi:CMP-N-acetylneuraminic acid synthetase